MNMKVEDSLAGSSAVGLDDVEAIRVDRAFDRRRQLGRYAGELVSGHLVERPDIGDVKARDDQGVPEGRRIVGKESDDMIIAVYLAGVWIVALNDLAERAVRIACTHCRPKWGGWP